MPILKDADWVDTVINSDFYKNVSTENKLNCLIMTISSLAKNVDYLRQERKNLVKTIVQWPELVGKQLTVEEARLLQVCRICKIHYSDNSSLTLDYGNEYCCTVHLDSKISPSDYSI